ncbi:MAG: hypothetical protein AB7O44_20490 [Hyphomicrobiaceae bacterium]
MDYGTPAAVEDLRQCLLTLAPTGDHGFEGLLAAALSEICGQPFRLASSGSQRGRDGDSAFDAGATYFEAKRYEDDVPKGTVSSKLVELIVDDVGQVDTWVLCSTSPISAQHAQLYQKSLERVGVGCLILDWADHTLPKLAVLLASAAGTTQQFIEQHGTDKSKSESLSAALAAIIADSGFRITSMNLGAMLREPTVGIGIAKAANKRWFVEAFSDRRIARRYFGQPLAPLEITRASWIERPVLLAEMHNVFAGPPGKSVVIVQGEEGTGKSWLTAKAWLAAAPAPLLAFFTPNELTGPLALHDVSGTFITKLAQQSEGELTDAIKRRWQRRFKGWRANPNPANVRLVVWVDGLNQIQDHHWPRWIDSAAAVLETLGGRLVLTTTAEHFARGIRGGVRSDIRSIVVRDWSLNDVKQVLQKRGITPSGQSEEVFKALRNPRILGLAIELLDAKEIEQFGDLSVERLLFEHVRHYSGDGSTPMSPLQFAHGLQRHADEIIKRISRQEHDDLRLFDAPLDDRLKAVSNSRFFKSVPGDPDRYEISDDGLPLALGLSLIATLRKEERNGRAPAVRLAEILEPILALARTGDVVHAAVLVACMTEDCPSSVTSALVRYYVGLQNLRDAPQAAFEALAKTSPEPFMQAAEAAALFVGHLPNMQSLVNALLKARTDAKAWATMSPYITRWLSWYCLAPEVRMINKGAGDQKVETERAKRKAEIEERLASLTPGERSLLDTRLERREETNLDDLHLLALTLLAGKPLSNFAVPLTNWSFSNALNSSLHAPHGAFQHLIQFNTLDWSATRHALHDALASIEKGGMSNVGEWALVGILRATGDAEDAQRASAMVEHLTRDRKRYAGWRLVEEYCATDPSDPTSDSPENIEATAASYAALDVAALHQGRGQTREDHLFSEARTGLARFKPGVAIGVLRSFARQVVMREGLGRRQGVISLAAHSAALEADVVDGLVAAAYAERGEASGGNLDDRHSWVAAQYGLLAALPHRSGNDQLTTIASLPSRTLLLRMLATLAPADETAVESLLESALVANDVDAQSRAVSFAYYSRSQISVKAALALGRLWSSPDKIVRFLALAIVARSGDSNLLKEFADGQWDATLLNPDDDRQERWYGSLALVAAAEAGVLDIDQAFARMAPQLYGYAAKRLGENAAKLAANLFDVAVEKACAQTDIPRLPVIEQPVTKTSDENPPLVSFIDERKDNDVRELFERMKETPEEYEARQQRAWHSFSEFSRRLTREDARLILDDLPWDSFEVIADAEPALAQRWLAALTDASAESLSLLHYFALGVAKACARWHPAAAAHLLQRLSQISPVVNRVFGPGRIPVVAVGIWASADVPEVRQLCFDRLDRAPNDEILASEVLAAFAVGKDAVVRQYIERLLTINEPCAIVRALMVCGLSDVNEL